MARYGSDRPLPDRVEGQWHALSTEEVLAQLRSSCSGLAADEARKRLMRFGANRLAQVRGAGLPRRFLLQFHNILIYVLLGAAAITAMLAHWVDTGVIIGVVVINAAIGLIQEGKAEAALAALRRMMSLSAHALRDGRRVTIQAEELVPGDVVLLGPGDKVPADLRLVEVRSLHVEEAALTGESEPSEKTAELVSGDAALGDRDCMAYAGTLVTFGQARGVVVATGAATEIGRISRMLEEVEEVTTPLLRQISGFGRRLTATILGFSVLTFGFGVWFRGFHAADMFLAVASIAVAAIPEGLPAIMTVTLAIGVQRMAKRNAIVRRLPAVETLGSVTVICSDKTGTLTRNEMTVRRVVMAGHAVEVSGVGYAPEGGFSLDGHDLDAARDPALGELGRAALLCNDAHVRRTADRWALEGDPTEGALHVLGLKAGLDPGFESERLPRTDAIPFDSEHRFMATLHHDHAGHGLIYLKGAPERVLGLCSMQLEGGEGRPLDRSGWERHVDACARAGLRVLALAMKPAMHAQRALTYADVQGGFTLLGLTALMDPPREEAIAAIARCRSAGVRVKMITGDHVVTAAAVGEQLGLTARGALPGAALDSMNGAALRSAVRETDVFARASPEHKLRVIQALQADGDIVAMTGDGVNDAPALKRADVGVAMGRKGTEAAKEASDMVIADDNFASIAAAVEEGRTVYDNIRKFLLFVLPTNGGEAGVLVVAILMGLTLPITPVQVLWVNMVTAVTLGLAFAFEPAEDGLMQRPPRTPGEPLLSGFLVWRIFLVTVVMVAGALTLFLWEHHRDGDTLDQARTIAVNVIVMGELVYLFNSRFLLASSISRRGLLGNRHAVLAVAVLIPLQLAFTYLPAMQMLFGTAPVDIEGWLHVLAFGAVLFLLVEAEKALLRSRRGRRSDHLAA